MNEIVTTTKTIGFYVVTFVDFGDVVGAQVEYDGTWIGSSSRDDMVEAAIAAGGMIQQDVAERIQAQVAATPRAATS